MTDLIYSTVPNCFPFPFFGIEFLSAEPLPELLSMPWCGEAVDVPPLIFVEDRVTAVPTGNLNRLASSRESGDVRSR